MLWGSVARRRGSCWYSSSAHRARSPVLCSESGMSYVHPEVHLVQSYPT